MEPDDVQPAPDAAPADADARSGRRACCVACATLVIGGLILAAVLPSLMWRWAKAMSGVDTRLVFACDGDARATAKAAELLGQRLRSAGLIARAEAQGTEVWVEVAEDWADDVEALTEEHTVRFQLVVEEDQLGAEAYAAELERARAAGEASAYEAAQAHPEARGYEQEPGAWLLLERGGLASKDFSAFQLRVDQRGEPTLGFTTTAAGAEALRALTAQNQRRRLAMIIDDRVRTTPVIMGPLDHEGVVDGGRDGWNDHEVRALAGALAAEPLPAKLTAIRMEPLGR